MANPVLNTMISDTQSTSRYTMVSTTTTGYGGVLRYTNWMVFNVDLSDAQQYTVQAKDLGRLDNLAAQQYGSPAYWWIIAMVNNIKNQLTDMAVGQVISLPSLSSAMAAIQENTGV